MTLDWQKCTGDQWCNFIKLNLNHSHFDNLEGVYIIWHGAPNPAVVYVGQGIIRDRLNYHRQSQEILGFSNLNLYVTWAEVDSSSRDGVEAYLANYWHPKVGEKHPNAVPIPVNSPWGT
jgi:hypothetical protein